MPCLIIPPTTRPATQLHPRLRSKMAHTAAVVEKYFSTASRPKTLQEVMEDLIGTVDSAGVEKAVQQLVQSKQLKYKTLSHKCTLFWRGESGHNNPVDTSSQAGNPGTQFRTPTRLDCPRGKRKHEVSCETKNPTISVEAVAKSVLHIKRELRTYNEEIHKLSRDYHEDELQVHIEKLHEYNETKDIGQILLGKLAEVEGATITTLYERFGLGLDD